MKHLIPLLAACALTSLHPLRASELDDLIVQVQTTKNPSGGVGQDAQKIAARISAIGAPAIPRLLPLLDDPDINVRQLAAYILSDIPGLTQKDLPLLMASQVRDNGWIAPAIARIGTPEAITFLVNELVRTRQVAGQLNHAIEILGPKALPELVGIYRRNLVWDRKLQLAMNATFRSMGEQALPAINPLLQIAQDPTASLNQRIYAMDALGAIGTTAAPAVPTLLELRNSDTPEIREASSSAIKSIGTSDATALHLENLQKARHIIYKVDAITAIAHFGPLGKSAAPTLRPYLDSPDWDLRLTAALALGAIGDESSVSQLTSLLDNKEDWRLSFAAARSLSLLHAEASLPALEMQAQTHWHPIVRQEADRAQNAIRKKAKPEPPPHGQYHQFLTNFHAYEKGMKQLKVMNSYLNSTTTFNRFSHPDPNPPSQILFRPNIGTLKYESLPGIPVENGFLSGADFGEREGYIMLVDPLGIPFRVSADNTQAIYRTQAGAIAITGNAHMDLDQGYVLKLHRNAEGQWTAKKWRALPGAPRFSKRLADGTILIVCHGGTVLLSSDGDLRFLYPSEAIVKIRAPANAAAPLPAP
jgi:HEAT repeat protein